VLDVTGDVLLKWRLLVEEGRKAGHTFSQPDLFIAATALHHGMKVVSRDTREYERAGVPVFNPWEAWGPLSSIIVACDAIASRWCAREPRHDATHGLFETSVQLQSTNAQTPGKTDEYQRPESKTIQQDREPTEICKTSTPGSNPGGASTFPKESDG